MTVAPIVVTRLAVRRRGSDAPPEDWVRTRVDLLRRLGWPALCRAGTGVAWVLLVDPDHRDLVAELLDGVELPDGSVHLAEGEGFVPETADLRLDGPVQVGHDAFVTLRIDSDDGLLPGAIDAVVAAAGDAGDGTLIDLPHGYQLDLDRRELIEVEYRRWRQGPFLAIVHHDRSTMFDTGGQHMVARAGREVRRVDRPAWIQGIHGANVSNDRTAVGALTRAARTLRAIPRREAAAAWHDGRVVGASTAAAILGAAGLADLV